MSQNEDRGYPPLPLEDRCSRTGDIKDAGMYTAAQMRAYVDADRAARAAPTQGHDWWRKRADEIELEVAKTGSREAMACYTQMRGLIQAVAAAPTQVEATDEAIEDFLAARTTPEGRVPMVKTIREALLHFAPAAQVEAGAEPIPADIERMAINRYRPVPAGNRVWPQYEVVAGDGTRSLFSGTKDECQIVARKLTEAFLDGAHAALAAQGGQDAQIDKSVGKAWDRFEAAMDKGLGLPPPGIHAAVHYAAFLRREAHKHTEPTKAGAIENAARMIDLLLLETRRLHQELIDAQGGQEAEPQREASDEAVRQWGERHDIRLSGCDLRCAFDDAATAHMDAAHPPRT